MSSSASECPDEKAVRLIYSSCPKNHQGLLRTSDLISYLETSASCIDENVGTFYSSKDESSLV